MPAQIEVLVYTTVLDNDGRRVQTETRVPGPASPTLDGGLAALRRRPVVRGPDDVPVRVEGVKVERLPRRPRVTDGDVGPLHDAPWETRPPGPQTPLVPLPGLEVLRSLGLLPAGPPPVTLPNTGTLARPRVDPVSLPPARVPRA